MTSLAFILGVVPLAVATGAGAEMRQSLGTAVIFGMLGVTLFGLLFSPSFYAVVRQLSGNAASQEFLLEMPDGGDEAIFRRLVTNEEANESQSAGSFQRCVFKTATNRVAPVREAVISVPTRSRSRTR
jgi:hypothetical protein